MLTIDMVSNRLNHLAYLNDYDDVNENQISNTLNINYTIKNCLLLGL